MPRVLFISPHLDDAVFSCAVQILRERRAGNDVLVATVFSHARPNSPASATYIARRTEDRVAAGILDARVKWLGLLDAPCRNPFYDSFRRIVLETAPRDECTVQTVESALLRLLRDFQPALVYAPLGVGTHIDHRLVYAATAAIWQKQRPIQAELRYYEERPYAYIRGSVALRLSQLGVLSREETLQPFTAFLRRFRRAPYVCRYLPPGPERRHVERVLAEMSCPETSASARGPVWSSHSIHGRPDERETIQRAIAAYASQISDFLGDSRHFLRREKQHAATLGSTHWRAERYWKQKGAVRSPRR